MSAVAPRTTFSTSRLLEFCSQKELTMQTGHEPDDWPLVIVKELIDNALDSAEETGVAPVIHVTVARGRIRVRDNGPGIPTETVTSILDFTTRTSSRRQDYRGDAVRLERQGGARRDRRVRHPSRDRLPSRSDRPATSYRPSAASARGRFGKKRHHRDGALA
jgi:hypothetical protein